MGRRKYTDEDLINAVKKSHSYSETCRNLGVSCKGHSLKIIKNKIINLGLDTTHFTGQRWNKGLTSYDNPSIKRRDISEVLTDKFPYSSHYIRKRLLREHIKECKCECCQRTEWLGIPIPLELHHINGNHYDNRLENLLILCPNCHALTDSHTNIEEIRKLINSQQINGKEKQDELIKIYNKKLKEKEENKLKQRQVKKKIKKVKQVNVKERDSGKRPDIITLLKDIKEINAFTKIGKKYGVSDNAVRKWCKTYGILDKLNSIDNYIKQLNNLV